MILHARRTRIERKQQQKSQVTNFSASRYVWVLGLCVTLSSGVFWLFFMRKSWLIVRSGIDHGRDPALQ